MTQTKRSSRAFADRRLPAFLLMTPAGLLLTAVTLIPLVVMVWMAFTDYDKRSLFTGAYEIVGFANFADILTDSAFWGSFFRTIWFTAALVIGSLVIGVGISHLMTRLGSKMRTAVTIVLVFTWAMPNVAASLVWNWMFQPGYGVLNWILTQLRIFGDMTSTDWGTNTALAFTSIWLLVVWQAVPFIALTVYAAETQVGQEYKEAARLDGANERRIYFNVTLPFLKPTILLITILSVIWDFNVFNQIWLVSRGGPDGSTSTLGVFTYITAFVSFDLGTGAALALITALLLAALTSVYIRHLIRSGEDEL
ncbi:carbohydrate ABC transporter permease [uncultured Microbacterium sp.]|uniref:carbohydrate ABC transporter permease n=1 Tax=uncultured Microbacterium sp. TaxID=191216 RepID=UPI00260DF0AD|nr:sugar ABC transporter permease [uncultured Microbacterium sp.]